MSNVQQLIKKYNNFIQNKKNKTALSCNCRNKNECLNGRLNGNCRLENIIYKCTSLTKNNVKKVYLGSQKEYLRKIGTTTTSNRSKMKIIKIGVDN